MASDETVEYYRRLQQSSRARDYWVGISPDDEAERWFFETIEDDDEFVVVRQLTVEADGTRRQYSVDTSWTRGASSPISPWTQAMI